MNFPKIDEQIEVLKNRGLIFKDEEKARKFILRENFYNLTTEYQDIFLNLKKSALENESFQEYQEETYFEELYAIYKLDRDLRNLIFDYINILEINLKSYISYVFSEKYGDRDFLKLDNFKEGKNVEKKFNELKEKIDSNLKRDKSDKSSNVQKFLKENGYLPLEVMTNIFTFGNTITFYSLMKIEERQRVAQNLNISPYSLEKYLRMLNIVRNICAHGNILFNIRFDMYLESREYRFHGALKIPIHKNEYKYGSNDLFSVMIIFKTLISKEDFTKLYTKIEEMLNEVKLELDSKSYKNLLEFMGFPESYEKLDELE